MPMLGPVNINNPSTAPATGPTPSTLTASGQPVDPTDSTDPVVGTEGLIYDPKVAQFGGMGAATVTDTNMLQNPFTGQSYSADLVIDGYEKIYGSDSTSLEGALMQQWGPQAVVDYLNANPGTSQATVQQESNQTQTNFELYGPWSSFTDPTTGVLSYFDANGVQYADGTGPANQMFTAIGTENTTGWDSATAL